MEHSPFRAPAPCFVFTLMFSVVGKFCVASTSHPSTHLVFVVALMNLFSPTCSTIHIISFLRMVLPKEQIEFSLKALFWEAVVLTCFILKTDD